MCPLSKTDIVVSILSFLMKPLQFFLKNNECKDRAFQEMFYDRTSDKADIKHYFNRNSDITLIGNPGEGKSSLMRYMFIELTNTDDLYPIILDLRAINPLREHTVISRLVSGLILYFQEIDRPITNIIENTTKDNYENHYDLAVQHLDSISNEYIHSKKRLVVFLDDLDFYENKYMDLLKNYFVAFSSSDKSMLVLSVRPPLYNSIKLDDELRHAFAFLPEKIVLSRVNLKELIADRIGTLFYNDDGRSIRALFGRIIRYVRKTDVVSSIRKQFEEHTKQANPDYELSEDHLDFDLGFNDQFYGYLNTVTGRNINLIERMLPHLFKWQQDNLHNEINYNTDFALSFIHAWAEDRDVLLDIVSEKTTNDRSRLNNNSVLQIVLEYFYSNSIVDSNYFDKMMQFGITKDDAERALSLLEHQPYSLIEPDYVYATGNYTVYRKYDINEKGRYYLTEIICKDEYYDALGTFRTNKRLLSTYQ